MDILSTIALIITILSAIYFIPLFVELWQRPRFYFVFLNENPEIRASDLNEASRNISLSTSSSEMRSRVILSCSSSSRIFCVQMSRILFISFGVITLLTPYLSLLNNLLQTAMSRIARAWAMAVS